MGQRYEFTFMPAVITLLDKATRRMEETSTVNVYSFPGELNEKVKEFIGPFAFEENDGDAGAESFLSRLDRVTATQFDAAPWAIILFPREYRLAGHLREVRSNTTDIRLSFYSALHPNFPGLAEAGLDVPPLSMLWVFEKEALMLSAASGSPLLKDAWNGLKTASVEKNWVYVADDLDPAWVSTQQECNTSLFMRHMGQ